MIYHLNVCYNEERIIDYLEFLYNFSSNLAEHYPYMAMAEYIELDWPTHENVMKNISGQFKNVTFELEGQGNDFHNLWKKVFFNGEMRVYQGNVWYQEVKEL